MIKLKNSFKTNERYPHSLCGYSGQVLGATIGLDVEDTMVKEDIMGTNRKEEKDKVGSGRS